VAILTHQYSDSSKMCGGGRLRRSQVD